MGTTFRLSPHDLDIVFCAKILGSVLVSEQLCTYSSHNATLITLTWYQWTVVGLAIGKGCVCSHLNTVTDPITEWQSLYEDIQRISGRSYEISGKSDPLFYRKSFWKVYIASSSLCTWLYSVEVIFNASCFYSRSVRFVWYKLDFEQTLKNPNSVHYFFFLFWNVTIFFEE